MIAPVEPSIVRPGGRFVADHPVIVAVDEVSWSVSVSGVIGEPVGDVGAGGTPTETMLVTVHVKVEVALKPALSVAVMVTA